MTRHPEDVPRDDDFLSTGEDLIDLPLGPRGETASPFEEPAPDPDAPFEPFEDPEAEPSRRRWLPLVLSLLAVVLVALGVAVGLLWPRGTPAVARLSTSLLEFGELQTHAESPPREVVVSNAGARPLTIASVALTGSAPGEFRVISDGCSGRELDASGQCTVLVGFVPAGRPGARSASLEVVGTFGNSPALVPVLGTSVAPVLSLDRHALSFGGRPVGDRGTGRGERVVVSNRGSAPLRLGRLTIEGSAAEELSLASDFCSGRRLRPDERCVVEVAFVPRSEGERWAELTVPGEGVAPSRVALSGIGLAARAEVAVLPAAVDFGDVRVGRASGGRTVRITNAGRGEARITAIELTGDQAGDFSLAAEAVRSCTRVEPGGGCAIELRFEPRRTGAHGARLAVRTGRGARGATAAGDAVAGDAFEVALTGIGVAPRLAVQSNRVDFGQVTVGQSAERTLTIANEGSAAMSLDRFAPTGVEAEDFRVTGGDCPTGREVLGAGVSCRLELRFTPRGPGRRAARLPLTPDRVDGPEAVVLAGVALEAAKPELSVAPSALGFGDQTVGQRSGIETIKLENTGNARLSLRRISLSGNDAGDFLLVAGTCDGLSFLAPGGDCTVGLRFAPSGPGTRRARLVVRHDAPGGETAVALTGLGMSSAEVIGASQ